MAHDYLIHSNEVHLIEKEEIHKAITQMIDTLHVAAGSTEGFDIYQVIETYFTDLHKRQEINQLLDIPQDTEYYAEHPCDYESANAGIGNNTENEFYY